MSVINEVLRVSLTLYNILKNNNVITSNIIFMHIKTLIFVLVFFTSSVFLFSQEQKNEKTIKYSNITELGIIGFATVWDILGGTTVNGIAIDKEHFVGIGLGIGLGRMPHVYPTGYFPLFANYRFYFIPYGNSSPHIDISAGGILSNNNKGFYSSLAIGFRVINFSFSLGIPFIAMACQTDYRIFKTAEHHWDYLYGATLKIGFTF